MRFLRHLIILFAVVLGNTQALSQVSEPQLKAAVLLKIIDYITWKDKEGQITITALESDTVFNFLKTLADPNKVTLESSEKSRSPQSIPAIHILGPLEKSVDATKTKTLVVDAEGNRDLEKVDIRLRVIDSRVVFDINLKSMDAKGATISSKILKLAKETIAAPRGSP